MAIALKMHLALCSDVFEDIAEILAIITFASEEEEEDLIDGGQHCRCIKTSAAGVHSEGCESLGISLLID